MTTESNDQRIARRYSQVLRRSFRSIRFRYIALSIIFGLVAIPVAFLGLWMIALCLLVAGLVCLSQHFDVVGNLHDIEARPDDKLVWSSGSDTDPLGTASGKPTTGPPTGRAAT